MKNNFRQDTINRIAVFRTDRIGEVLLATPVIEALKKRFPQAKISFITSPLASDIVSGTPDIDELIIFDTIFKKVPLWKAIPLSIKLRDKKFDIAVILNPHKVLHMASFLAGIRCRVGFDRKWGFLLTHRIEDRKSEGMLHEVDYNLELLNAIGIDEKKIAPFISVSDESISYVENLFRGLGIYADKKIVALHPGSSNPAKRWPSENFKELAKRLIEAGIEVVVIGDNTEKALCQEVNRALPKNIHNLAGTLTIRQLAALLKKVNLLITNDNGPMHIAAAVGTKVIAIFGRNIPGVSPRRWGPYGRGHIVFHKDPGCSPCYDKACPYDFKCLRSITPEDVYSAATEILI